MGYSSWGQKELDMTEHTHMYIYICVYVCVYTHTHRHTHVSSRRVFLNIHYAKQAPNFSPENPFLVLVLLIAISFAVNLFWHCSR